MPDRTVLIVGASPELETVLAQFSDTAVRIRVIPTPSDALRALGAARHPRVRAVLVDLRQDEPRALEVVRTVRAVPGMDRTPLAAWGFTPEVVTRAYEAGANSGVVLQGTKEDPERLAEVVHYWAVTNQPLTAEPLA